VFCIRFVDGIASQSTGRGGAIFFHGAAHDTRNVIVRSEFEANRAMDGGAIHVGTFVSVTDSNFTANEAGALRGADLPTSNNTSVDVDGGNQNYCNVHSGFGSAIFALVPLPPSSSLAGQSCLEAFSGHVVKIERAVFQHNACDVAGTVYWSLASIGWTGSCETQDFCTGDDGCAWENNTARGYGPNAATSPVALYVSALPTDVYPGVPFSVQIQAYDALGSALRGGHEAVDIGIQVEQNVSDTEKTASLLSSSTTTTTVVLASLSNGALAPKFRLIGQPLLPFTIHFRSNPALQLPEPLRTGALSQCPPGNEYLPKIGQCKLRCPSGQQAVYLEVRSHLP
jgi:hypothetical protein